MEKRLTILLFLLLVIGLAGLAWAYLSPQLTAPEGDIKFSHALHVGEQEVDCETCHASVDNSAESSDDNLPAMDVCGNCHDVEDATGCGACHKNPDDPGGYGILKRELIFSHKNHISRGAVCGACHKGVKTSVGADPAILPLMKDCFVCHNDAQAMADCEKCHGNELTLLDIHPVNWRHEHGARAASDPAWCQGCHSEQSFCLDCHRGDNLRGEIHDLNYIYTHGLDAKGKAADCSQCHDNQTFCVACHESGNRMPQRHSLLTWLDDHGRYAREDVENCASCHDNGDPTCARVGCHNDFDGVKGTDPRIHDPNAAQFDIHGPWHNDQGYYCYQCHVRTGREGEGFCGYCHD
jgi:hypothetical protein